MILRTLTTLSWLSGLALGAARDQPVRHQDQHNTFANSTKSSSSSIYDESPLFSFSPATTRQPASPSPTLSTPIAASTRITSSHYHGPPPIGPGSRPFPSPSASASATTYAPSYSFQPTTSGNDTCGGATINVINATLDWWYDSTVLDPVYTVSFEHAKNLSRTAWTIISETSLLNVSTAISTTSCDSPVTYTNDDGSTYTIPQCYNVPWLTAAPSTTGITVQAFVTPDVTSGTDVDDVPNYRRYPPLPTATVPGSNATFGSDSPFVYFNAYQVVSSNFTRFANGDGICNSVTKQYNLSSPYAFSYSGPDPESATDGLASITGDLDPYLPTALGQPSLTVGSFTARPTVVVVVVEAFSAVAVAYVAQTMKTATMLDIPSPTLPSGVSATSDSNFGANLYSSLTALPSAQVQTTNKYLIVPVLTSTLPPLVVQSDAIGTSSPTPGSSPNGAGNNEGSNTVGGGVSNGGSNSGSKSGGDSGSDQAGKGDGDNGAGQGTSNALQVLTAALGPAILSGLGITSTSEGITVAGATASPTPIRALVVAGQTAVAGGAPITADGNVISVLSGGSSVVIGSSTMNLPSSMETITADGMQITAAPAQGFVIAGQTALPGAQAITVSGTPVSVAPDGNTLVVGSMTSVVVQPRIITVGTQTVTANGANQFVFGSGQTLTQGGMVVVSGSTISLATGATAFVVNGATSTIAAPVYATITGQPALTINGHIIPATSAGAYIVSGQTLAPGGAVTFSGPRGLETISLDKSGSSIVDVVSGTSATSALQSTLPVLTIGGTRITAQAGGYTYIIGGQTLTAGGVKTVTINSSTFIVSLAATPTVAEIEQVGSSGQITATTYETLSTSGPTQTGSDKTSPQTTVAPQSGQAISATVELLSFVTAGAALLIAAWL